MNKKEISMGRGLQIDEDTTNVCRGDFIIKANSCRNSVVTSEG